MNPIIRKLLQKLQALTDARRATGEMSNGRLVNTPQGAMLDKEIVRTREELKQAQLGQADRAGVIPADSRGAGGAQTLQQAGANRQAQSYPKPDLSPTSEPPGDVALREIYQRLAEVRAQDKKLGGASYMDDGTSAGSYNAREMGYLRNDELRSQLMEQLDLFQPKYK